MVFLLIYVFFILNFLKSYKLTRPVESLHHDVRKASFFSAFFLFCPRRMRPGTLGSAALEILTRIGYKQ